MDQNVLEKNTPLLSRKGCGFHHRCKVNKVEGLFCFKTRSSSIKTTNQKITLKYDEKTFTIFADPWTGVFVGKDKRIIRTNS